MDPHTWPCKSRTQLNSFNYCYMKLIIPFLLVSCLHSGMGFQAWFILIVLFDNTIKWFQVMPCNINISIKLQSFACTQLNGQTVLFDPEMRPSQVLRLQVRIDQGVITMKVYSTLPKSPGLEPHHQIVQYHN